MARIVTLTTDFGTADGYVGAMKGVILALAPAARVVDLTHEIPRHDVAAGAFALAAAARWFPEGTVHLAVVDPGVGGRRRAVVVDDGRQLYVGPDNGLFALAVPRVVAAHEIAAPAFRLEAVSATFHGRDVFAPAAARLASGRAPREAGPPVLLTGALPGARVAPRARGGGTRIEGRIVHIDRFGNLISDIQAEEVPRGARVRVGRLAIAGLAATFEDVAPGRPLAYAGSVGTLEIAVREGSAAERHGIARGARVEVLEGERAGAARPAARRRGPARTG